MTGVGTVIKTGDYVDMVVGIRADKFPVITTNPADDSFTVVSGLNGTSVKLLLQGMQVLGTLLPPPPTHGAGQEGQPRTVRPGTALTGQQEIVALAVDAQQAEVIKFAQMDGAISLILRSPDDFTRPGRRVSPSSRRRCRMRRPASSSSRSSTATASCRRSSSRRSCRRRPGASQATHRRHRAGDHDPARRARWTNRSRARRASTET